MAKPRWVTSVRARRAGRRLGAAAVLAALAAAGAASPAAAAPFSTGFGDESYLSPDAATRQTWLDRTAQAGAGTIRLTPGWHGVAPTDRPAGFDPSNPADPAYDWRSVDAAVRDAAARGLEVILLLHAAPPWAEGPGRDPAANPGTWRPDPGELGAYARAAALRYSGAFPDPERPGAALPRIRHWEVWNEPNLQSYLAPQWIARDGRWLPDSPVHYRRMLNAAYGAIKAVRADNVVVSGGLGPYGDHQAGGRRIAPALFLRELTCLSGERLRADGCPEPASLDGIAHHPYGVAGPRRRALNADDAAVPDVGRLTSVLTAARRNRRVRAPRRPHVWVTEISWDSAPPDPDGVPSATHARWLSEAMYVLWRQGVEKVTWFQVRDADAQAAGGYAFSNQSGVFMRDGTPKRSLEAFRFPFVAERAGRGRVGFWGRAPARSRARVQRRAGSRWVTIARARTDASRVFRGTVALRGRARLRAVAAGRASLPWSHR